MLYALSEAGFIIKTVVFALLGAGLIAKSMIIAERGLDFYRI